MEKPEKTLADYVAIALSPGLIMALVGSLVFFLLEILYVGQFYGSLKWVLFFFVFGAVLVSRISMQTETADRAPLYGLVLGGLMWLALQKYVEYPPGSPWASWGWALNLGLIALIWWSAHRLTRDCTLIDDEVDASGVGLLEVVGIEKPRNADPKEPVAAEANGKKKKKEKETGGLRGWWQRYSKYREERGKRPHAPGVWVVYFSLAALPLFGLGQSQIPPDDERRAYTFWLMCIYTGSGLGLLLTTSFLGLRRYLRQRKLRMPAAMTGVWMMLGLLLVAAFLFVGAMLPRPGDPVPLLEWVGVAQSKPRKASDHAQVGDPGKEKGRSAKSKKGRDQKGDDKKGGKSKDGKKEDSSGGDEEKAGKKSDDARPGGGGTKKQQGRAGTEDPEDDEAGQRPDRRAGTDPPLSEFWDNLAKILKWIVIAALILVTAFFVLRGALRFLANFTKWADRLLAALRAWWGKLWNRQAPADDDVITAVVHEPPPFASFSDPFVSGAAARMSPEELVRYSFAALEAWAWQRHLGRETGETPLEFVHRVASEVPALEAEVRRLGDLYVGLAYARQTLSTTSVEPLREFWHMLMAVHERPWSAASAESLALPTGGAQA